MFTILLCQVGFGLFYGYSNCGAGSQGLDSQVTLLRRLGVSWALRRLESFHE